MKLIDYLARNHLTARAFAPVIGLSVGGISKILSGERHPRRETVSNIARVTGGQVMPNDWFPELSDLINRPAEAPNDE
ncbi:2-oxoglutarate dehydrogenase E1 component [Stappia sp. 22II-S9-Z10]|nr:2-oxoglutarate dehydrogenase E1 component [Stappia sp. 22II-S9-Z10]